ncbi:tetratricopeptide repeat protein [Candidatus Poriferisocius sp.]|uniref:tetratricopeptide repeat protein n=1 Tax=Candidatus Poriferisocius sp. TaxID=3101276 RepID=UPI003B5BFE30
MLEDRGIASVSVEDPDGGAFDDVVVRRRVGGHIYIQAKSSNYADSVVDRDMLLTAARPGGISPLRRFYATYTALSEDGGDFSLEFWTHRAFDDANPLLGALRDLRHDRIAVDRMLAAGQRSEAGTERDAWADHLGVSADELAGFLRRVRWKHTGSELDLRGQAKTQMKLVGLRGDDAAVTVGIGIVRDWVSDGAGPQTAEDVGRRAAEMSLVPDASALRTSDSTSGGEALAGIPPACRDRLAALREVSADVADRVTAELLNAASRVPGVLARLADTPPEWLQDVDCLAWEAIADFVGAHELPGAPQLRDRAVALGSPRSSHYRVAEALMADEDDDEAARLLDDEILDHPLAAAARSLIGGDLASAAAEARRSGALGSDDTGLATMAIQVLGMAHARNGELSQAIRVMRDAVVRFPDRASFHLTLARLQLGLAQEQGEPVRPDLPESAAENAIRARDEFRKWHGPSAEAVVIAANAYHMVNQHHLIIDLATAQPEGEATSAEAEDGEVARILAHTLVMVGRGDEIDESALDRIDGSENTLIRALQALNRGDPAASDLMREAIAQAEGDRDVLMALEGLALLGETDEGAMARVALGNEAGIDGIRASAAYNRGDLDAAIEILDNYRCQSAAHVGLLAVALHGQGRSDDALEALLESAEALNDPMLYQSAVQLLLELEEFQQAEEVALRALAANPSRATESRLRTALVEAAEKLRDWPQMERYAQALADAFPDDPRARWAVVFAQHQQGRHRDAWGYLAEHDLRPDDEQMALLATGVYLDAGAPGDGVDRLFWIAGEFEDSEKVVGSALAALMAGSRQEGQLSESQAAELNELVEGFVRQYPESDVLSHFSFSGPEEFLEMLRASSEQPARQRAVWVRRVRLGMLPYGMLQWIRPFPYAEYLLVQPAAYLTAVSPDAVERGRSRAAARAAIGAVVAVDTSVAALGHLASVDVAAMGSAFSRVLVASELLDDARAAVGSVETAADASAGYDPVLGDFNLSEIQDEDRQRMIESARQVLGTLNSWQTAPSSRVWPPGFPRIDDQRPWNASIRLALDRGCALWCDDLALRRIAVEFGVPAFGTYDLYEALAATAETGGLASPSEMKMLLLRARIADVPISLGELSDAIDDTDGPDPAAELLLGRPATWADNVEETLRWYLGRVATLISGPHRDRTASLLVAASVGLGTAAVLEHRQKALGRVLADTLWLVNDPAMTPLLLEASRYAGREIDLAANLDPLEQAVRRLQERLQEQRIDADIAAGFVQAIFSQTQPADRLAVSSILFANR